MDLFENHEHEFGSVYSHARRRDILLVGDVYLLAIANDPLLALAAPLRVTGEVFWNLLRARVKRGGGQVTSQGYSRTLLDAGYPAAPWHVGLRLEGQTGV